MAWTTVATIDTTWTCHGWKGWLRGLMDTGEDFHRMGETGSVGQKTGTRAPESEIVVERIYDSLATAYAGAEALEAMARDIVRICGLALVQCCKVCDEAWRLEQAMPDACWFAGGPWRRL